MGSAHLPRRAARASTSGCRARRSTSSRSPVDDQPALPPALVGAGRRHVRLERDRHQPQPLGDAGQGHDRRGAELEPEAADGVHRHTPSARRRKRASARAARRRLYSFIRPNLSRDQAQQLAEAMARGHHPPRDGADREPAGRQRADHAGDGAARRHRHGLGPALLPRHASPPPVDAAKATGWN